MAASGPTGLTADALRAELRSAVRAQANRGLLASAKWLSEQLCGLGKGGGQPMPAMPALEAVPDTVLLAQSLFAAREHRRAAHVLQDTPGHEARFLRLYSLFLVGERKKDDEMDEEATTGGEAGESAMVNGELAAIEGELSPLYEQQVLDGYCLYLYGMVLKHMRRESLSVHVLCQAVAREPTLWCAWLDIAANCTDRESVAKLTLPDHWMAHFFHAHVCLELQHNSEALTILDRISRVFPRSTTVKSMIATAHYQLREFDTAQAAFEKLLQVDPYRLDHMDIYSNILYVKESKRALSYAAQFAVSVDKYRPETCCIVGNYFSLRAEHEKAVVYFQRALRLDRNYLSAWTLMGHEYVELKNTAAAIHAYRRAVDINPRDYRAWYALGQAYEILQMPFYALFYHRKAATIRPYDSRMWTALGGCYKALGRKPEVRGGGRGCSPPSPSTRWLTTPSRPGHSLLRARRVQQRSRGRRPPGARPAVQGLGPPRGSRPVLCEEPRPQGLPGHARWRGHGGGAQVPRRRRQEAESDRRRRGHVHPAPGLRRTAGASDVRQATMAPCSAEGPRHAAQDVEEAKAMLRDLRMYRR